MMMMVVVDSDYSIDAKAIFPQPIPIYHDPTTGKQCQTSHWRAGHKKECQAVSTDSLKDLLVPLGGPEEACQLLWGAAHALKLRPPLSRTIIDRLYSLARTLAPRYKRLGDDFPETILWMTTAIRVAIDFVLEGATTREKELLLGELEAAPTRVDREEFYGIAVALAQAIRVRGLATLQR